MDIYSPLDRFNKEQKFWYAQLIVATILADDEIDVSEIESLKQALSFIDDMDEQKILMNMIHHKTMPQIGKPKGLNKMELAWIFTELILIIIKDGSISVKEKVFLRKVADFFEFNKNYYNKLMSWCEQGILWKKERSIFVSKAH